ncbi:receptor activity-modifying protein 2-like [Micropterus dolomieu]|uniref:receptor activity-modifying protein 2-like n=1 Tax=Micropterus dolomieu TaxID=147949 RepID=UPI001E8EAA9A|nr:receptor activity-modifying protein 2-like [Micropterus dolomieu]
MILYLLFAFLTLGVAGSQAANMTEVQLSKAEGNQTFSEPSAGNSTMKLSNTTSSLDKDTMNELQNNQTSTLITEDDENFQEQETEFPGRRCKQDLLVEYSHGLCGAVFHMAMLSITENWCVMENIIRPYNNMTLCLEMLSGVFGCYYPNPSIQDFFIDIHTQYFQNCSWEEPLLVDAPQNVVIALTLIPVSLLPLLIYLMVWRINVQK